MKQLNPDKFERLIKWYFQRNLANSVDIPAKNENGKSGDTDVIATFDNLKLIIEIVYHKSRLFGSTKKI